MKMFSEVLGNMVSDPSWNGKLKNVKIEYLNLDQWTAQKSRFIAKTTAGVEYAVASKRKSNHRGKMGMYWNMIRKQIQLSLSG